MPIRNAGIKSYVIYEEQLLSPRNETTAECIEPSSYLELSLSRVHPVIATVKSHHGVDIRVYMKPRVDQ